MFQATFLKYNFKCRQNKKKIRTWKHNTKHFLFLSLTSFFFVFTNNVRFLGEKEKITKALFSDNLKTDILNEYLSYFLEQNILIFNQCNSKT